MVCKRTENACHYGYIKIRMVCQIVKIVKGVLFRWDLVVSAFFDKISIQEKMKVFYLSHSYLNKHELLRWRQNKVICENKTQLSTKASNWHTLKNSEIKENDEENHSLPSKFSCLCCTSVKSR